MPSQDRLYSDSFLWVSHTNALSRVEFSLLYLMCTLVQYVGGDLHGLYSSGSDRRPPQGGIGDCRDAGANGAQYACMRFEFGFLLMLSLHKYGGNF